MVQRPKFPLLYILEASAGSGKTTALAQRYVEFVLSPSSKDKAPSYFPNILAVTFTNEAANQMKRKVLNKFKEIALSKNGYREFARKIVDEILKNYSEFHIKTIDSFMHSILLSSALQLKLPPYKEILEESQPYLEYILERVLKNLSQDTKARRVFLNFIKSYLTIEGKRSWRPQKELLKIIRLLHSKQDERGKIFLNPPSTVSLKEIERETRRLLRSFFLLIKKEKVNINKRLKFSSDILRFSSKHFFKEIFKYSQRELLQIVREEDIPPSLKNLWERIRNLAKEAMYYYVFRTYSPYLEVFKLFEDEFEDFKHKRRIIFLEELSKKARDYLSGEDFSIPEVYYKLSSIFYHYLIDEFQDTNRLQWENIKILIEEAISKGGSLVYVGDKKQAIYRFRGGDISLFNEIEEDMKNRVNRLKHEYLNSNFRSKEEIIRFNNLVFSPENIERFLKESFPLLSQEDIEVVKEIFKKSSQTPQRKDKEGGYLYIERIESENQDEEKEIVKEKLISLLRELENRFPWNEIMILTRRRQEEELISSWLIEENIPVESSRTVDIRENYLIKEIISFLKFLNSPIDNLSFASFIMGDILAKRLDKNEEFFRGYMERVSLERYPGVLYRKFREDFPQIWQDYIQDFFKCVGFLPPYDLVSLFIRRFEVRKNFPSQEVFFMKLLEILKDLESVRGNSLFDFLEYIDTAQEEKFFIRPSSSFSVRVYTIHKAKGLESRVVILPFLKLKVEPTRAEEGSKLVYEEDTKSRIQGLRLLYLPQSICKDEYLEALYRKQFLLSLIDELNTLYVAFTRSRDEIYGFLPNRILKRKNPLVSLIFRDERKLLKKGSKVKFLRKERESPKSLPEIQAKILDPHFLIKQYLSEEIPEEGLDKTGRKSIERGIVCHYALSLIDYLKESWKEDLRKSVSLSCQRFFYEKEEEIFRILLRILKMKELRDLFREGFRIFNEIEIIDRTGQLKRIDRLVITEDKIIVLDYKTGKIRDEDLKQINIYKDMLKEIYPQKKIEAFLIYIDEGLLKKG